MAAPQIAQPGTTLSVVVRITDTNGAAAAATLDDTTTRIEGYAAVPTFDTISVGNYRINFTGLSPETEAGDQLVVKVNGAIDGGSAFSEWLELVSVENIANDVSGLATQAELDKVAKKDAAQTWTHGGGEVAQVTITQA